LSFLLSAVSEDARWTAERQAVEFGVEIGEYHGVVRVSRRLFQRLLPERPTPEQCVEAYDLQRTRFESIAERKLRRRPIEVIVLTVASHDWFRHDQDPLPVRLEASDVLRRSDTQSRVEHRNDCGVSCWVRDRGAATISNRRQ
jgi:hypothetical protein